MFPPLSVPPSTSPQSSPAQRTRLPPGQMNCSRSEEHTSELQSLRQLVCRLLLEKKRIIRWSKNGWRSRWPRQCEENMACKICLLKCQRSFFFNDTATTEIYTLSLHDALPI